jgi:predicted nucleic acid-binding Zn ribbon protein
MKVCAYCGKEFDNYQHKKYCSDRCAGLAFRKQKADRQQRILEASKEKS